MTLVEMPIQYESVLGTDVHPELAAEVMDVPPTWVRDRINHHGYADLCQWACLSKRNAHQFPAEVRQVLIDYVKGWLQYGRKHGTNLIVCGGTYKRRDWAAAAALNEIVMRFSQSEPMQIEWLNLDRVRKLLDARVKKDDLFWTVRNRLETAKIVLFTDPTRAANQEERAFVEYVFSTRINNKLPTITTLHPHVAKNDFKAIQDRLGWFIAEILEGSHHGFIASLDQ